MANGATYGLVFVFPSSGRQGQAAAVLSFLQAEVPAAQIEGVWLARTGSGVAVRVELSWAAYRRKLIDDLNRRTTQGGGTLIETPRVPDADRARFADTFLAGAVKMDHLAATLVVLKAEAPLAAAVPPARPSRPGPPPSAPPAPVPSGPMEVRIEGAAQLFADYKAHLSVGAAFIPTAQRPALFSNVQVRFVLPGGRVLETSARVVYAVEAPHPGIGVDFSGDALCRLRLKNFVEAMAA